MAAGRRHCPWRPPQTHSNAPPNAGAARFGSRPAHFSVEKPFFGAREVCAAAVADAPLAQAAQAAIGTTSAPPAAANGAPVVSIGTPGRVPGRPVLEVPGWQDQLASRVAPQGFHAPPPSRLRIFSGTSNQVGGGGGFKQGGGATRIACSSCCSLRCRGWKVLQLALSTWLAEAWWLAVGATCCARAFLPFSPA